MPHPQPPHSPRLLRGAVSVFTFLLVLSGCALVTPQPGGPAAGQPLQIVTSIYPLNFVASAVAGPDAEVTSLIPAGADAHHGEISLRQLRHLQDADLLFYLSDFQPAVDQAVRSNPPAHVLEVSEHIELHAYDEDDHDHSHGHEDEHAEDHDEHDQDKHAHGHDHGTLDPHFWLDPTNLATLAEALGEQLAVQNPENAAAYRQRATELAGQLNALAADFTSGLENCASDTVVVSHAAFGYLTDPLGITQIGIAGLDPDSEPSLARIRQIRDVVAEYEVSTVFYESPTNPFVAQKVADSLGLRTAFLDPLEIQYHPGQDYLTVMEQNLTTLRTSLECQ